MWLFGDILDASKFYYYIQFYNCEHQYLTYFLRLFRKGEILILNLKCKHNIYIYTPGYAYFISEYVSIAIYKNLIKILGLPKSSLGFSLRCCGKTWTNVLANPVFLEKAKLLRLFYRPLGESFLGTILISTLSHKEIIYTSKC